MTRHITRLFLLSFTLCQLLPTQAHATPTREEQQCAEIARRIQENNNISPAIKADLLKVLEDACLDALKVKRHLAQ